MSLPFEKAFPEEFDFYHLGQVKLKSAVERPNVRNIPISPINLGTVAAKAVGIFEYTSSDKLSSIGYTFNGDINCALIVSFDRNLDLSTYMELGNVLASRIATQLCESGLDVMISAPNILTEKQLRSLIGGGANNNGTEAETNEKMSTRVDIIQKTYLHEMVNCGSVEIKTLLITLPSAHPYLGRIGHA